MKLWVVNYKDMYQHEPGSIKTAKHAEELMIEAMRSKKEQEDFVIITEAWPCQDSDDHNCHELLQNFSEEKGITIEVRISDKIKFDIYGRIHGFDPKDCQKVKILYSKGIVKYYLMEAEVPPDGAQQAATAKVIRNPKLREKVAAAAATAAETAAAERLTPLELLIFHNNAKEAKKHFTKENEKSTRGNDNNKKLK